MINKWGWNTQRFLFSFQQSDLITLTPLLAVNVAQMNHFDSEAVLISGSFGFNPGSPETGGA